MSKLMIGSSVLREWIEAPDGDKEYTDLYIMIDELKSSILNVVKVQTRMGFDCEDNKMLQYVNATMVGVAESLQKLFEEVQDQIIPLAREGGER
ncbi:MAG: hypothetical protein MJZ94_06605 [Bacteroidales bacterium]|nr:hypothetical protein [Bacteroidales bacterium]